ncbi:hypothetical protein ILUMI_15207 [Ignelater luminosus]|uniref:Uncharacterized protein n=1 Tax=Ignelater luminosus TaxID=2038154 RepID=A0A8K0CTH7_IGNLU|nr:hypothetical protein ILUMI_15207 [Ignelater luminosus]
MGKQDEDWKNLREAWSQVDKSHNWYSRLLTWWSENEHDQKIVLKKITALKHQSNCPTSLQKWIFKSATTSTKTTATSEPARSSKTVATTQPPTSSNNVQQAKELTQKLNRAENLRKAQQKSREKKKLEAPQTSPKPKRGRPPIEKEQGLQEAISNLVYYGASADDRRRSEILKCAKTVDELLAGLKDQGK